MSTSATPGKSAYTLLYTLGTVSLLFCAGFMIRIAWYIWAGAEPLAALNFLPADYRIFAPLGLISIAVVGIFCWHKGAQLQERANHNSSGR